MSRRSQLQRALRYEVGSRGARAHTRTLPGWLALVTVVITMLQVHAVDAQACKDLDIDSEDCPDPLNWESSRGLGLGLGLRSSSASTSALMYNPAGLVVGGVYHIEGNVDYLAGQKTVALGAAVTDSATSRLAGGLAVRGFLSGRDGYDGIDGRLALAFPFSDAVSIGLAGRYVSVSQEVEQEDGEYRDEDLAEGITLDASFRFQVEDVVVFDVAAYNFVDRDSPWLPLSVGFSAGFMFASQLVLGIDVLGDMSNFESPAMTAGGGLEYLAGESVPLRGGYSYDTERQLHRLTLGLGYTDKMVGVDLGLRQDLAGGDDTRVMLAIRYYVQ